jgi:hypothetical protein
MRNATDGCGVLEARLEQDAGLRTGATKPKKHSLDKKPGTAAGELSCFPVRKQF